MQLFSINFCSLIMGYNFKQIVMSQARNNKLKVCLNIRFLYHGYRQSIHFPLILGQKTRQSSNIKTLNCQFHRHVTQVYFQELTFGKVLQKALVILRQKHFNKGNRIIRIPHHLQAVRIFNVTKHTNLKQFGLQDYLSHIFLDQQGDETMKTYQNDSTKRNIQIYLRWPIQNIKISYMDYFWTNIVIQDLHSSIELITSDFRNIIIQKLKYQTDVSFSIVNASQNVVVEQSMKFHQYRETFEKSDDENEWLLIFNNKENADQSELKLCLESEGIDVEKLVCPISQQIMLNPRYIQKCRHYFEETFILLTLFIHKKCPLCKIEASPNDTVLDKVAKQFIDLTIQECKVVRRLNELSVMARMYQVKK